MRGLGVCDENGGIIRLDIAGCSEWNVVGDHQLRLRSPPLVCASRLASVARVALPLLGLLYFLFSVYA